MEIIKLEDVQLIKQGQAILNGVSFVVTEGEFTAVLGPSGAGKSSLFRTMNLLHSVTSGTISYRGKNILEYDTLELRRQIGYILQKPYLFGNLVRENLVYPYQLLRRGPDLSEINTYLEKVNLPTSILDKKNSELSGGEQQRVALVRSLLIQPKVLLLDEVTAALDEENSLLIEQLVAAERQARNMTVLFITHNEEQARRLADKVLYLSHGQIKFYGPQENFFQQRRAVLDE